MLYALLNVLDDVSIFERLTIVDIDEDDVLETFHELLKCDCIDVARVKIGNSIYDLIVDDEGLFKSNPIPSAINTSEFKDLLVGNILISKSDKSGKTIDLTLNDLDNILENIRPAINKHTKEMLLWLSFTR